MDIICCLSYRKRDEEAFAFLRKIGQFFAKSENDNSETSLPMFLNCSEKYTRHIKNIIK